jgi:hypothetical protein
MRSAVAAFTVTEVPIRLEPVTADPFIDALEDGSRGPGPQDTARYGRNSQQECRSSAASSAAARRRP